ncbi:MAG: hypothetical protein H6622_03130 [Halobacteriovoraceae bacterium]|nr:hypothetical protein [Halobacteriovoraceae bacterium]
MKILGEKYFHLTGSETSKLLPIIYIFIANSTLIFTFYNLFYHLAIKLSIMGIFKSLVFLIFQIPLINYLNLRAIGIISAQNLFYFKNEAKIINLKGKELNFFNFSFSLLFLKILKLIDQKNENKLTTTLKESVVDEYMNVFDFALIYPPHILALGHARLKELPGTLENFIDSLPQPIKEISVQQPIKHLNFNILKNIFVPSLIVSTTVGIIFSHSFIQSWSFKFTNAVSLNLFPIFGTIAVFYSFLLFLNSIVAFLNSSYFSIFYIALTKSSEIDDKFKLRINKFLDHNDRLNGITIISKDMPNQMKPSTPDKLLKKIANTFQKNVENGVNTKKITLALLKKGYSKEDIEKGHALFKKNKHSA